MSTHPPSGTRHARRRHRRRTNRYYRTTSPVVERMKTIGTALLVVGGVGFLVWVFVFYR